ncbi:MAG: hypothetical protein HGB00_08305 [Chlorobiaceae bacterium]|nr:hypothetical protein [Chlorobiaceae bacterium]
METKKPSFEQLPELVQALGERIGALEERICSTHMPAEEELPMSVEACAEFLSNIEGKTVRPPAIYNRVACHKLPFRKNGSKLYFYRSEILLAIKNSTAIPTPPAIVDQDETRKAIAI